jgi:hypothetical protein
MRSLYARLAGVNLCLIASDTRQVPGSFSNVQENNRLHATLLREVQRLRGRVYVRDGAIPPSSLDSQGRHVSPHDNTAWHIVLREESGRVLGSIRVTLYCHADGPIPLDSLHVARLLERCPASSRPDYLVALTDFIGKSRQAMPCFFEAAGLVVAPEVRSPSVTPVIMASICSLSLAFGGAWGTGAATNRHNTAAMWKRYGGFPLPYGAGTLRPYYDDYHGCEMEILGFSTDRLHPVLAPTVSDIETALRSIPVITSSSTEHIAKPARP